MRLPRRGLVALLAALLCSSACAKKPAPSRFSQRLVILGFDGMDPTLLNRWIAAGQLPNIARLAAQGGVYPARDDAVAGVADRVGVVRHRREPRQAQHLRLPGPRHQHLPAGSRHGPARAGDVPLRLPADREAEGDFDPRRHLVLGHRRTRRRAIQRPHGAGDLPAGGRAERRAAGGAAAARHPRHDGHVLLLRHRLEPLRGRQHRVRRHPQAAA